MSRYDIVITDVFKKQLKTQKGQLITFTRGDLERSIQGTNQTVRNIGDLIYSYRFRKDLHKALPKDIQKLSGSGKFWTISLVGSGKYAFRARANPFIKPSLNLVRTAYKDKTPATILKHSQKDEQALLARVRYSGVLDEFLGLTCYSLQNHWRTNVPEIGQTEIDELYIGTDAQGKEYIIPIQAKGGKDTISLMQIEQDFAVCKAKYPGLAARAVAVYFQDTQNFSLFEFTEVGGDAQLIRERAYSFV